MRLLLFCSLLFIQFLVSGQETSKAELDLETAYLDAQLQKYIGNSDLQKEKLLACIETDRSNSTLQYQLARIYLDEKDYRNALTFANKAAKLDNTNKWFFLLVADINEILLDYTAANTALANAIAIDARNPILQYRIAHNYQKNQDFDACIAKLKEIEAKYGKSEESTYKLVDVYNTTDRYALALEELIQLSAKYPNDVNTLNAIANQYTLVDKAEKAQEYYRKVLELDSDNTEANMQIVQANMDEAKDSEYLYSITPLIENPAIPFDNKIIELIPYVEQMQQNTDKEYTHALQSLTDQLTAMYPSEAKAHAIRGDVMYLSGQLESALKSYNKTLEYNDTVFAVWIQKLNLLFDLQDTDGLAKFADKTIEYYPNNIEGYFWMAIHAYTTNNTAEANAYLSEMKLVSGGNAEALRKSDVIAALLLAQQGQNQDAKTALQKLNATKSIDPLELQLLGAAYQLIGDEQLSQTLNTRAIEMGNVSMALNPQ